ncbi:type II secretion system F family protein [Nitrosopumilus sp. K4]|uniref:type II secretion system F family protein n=1 Tax=Nitrosopumilus sp. K4 TaxID=2795383 RepID=UPI001BAE0124|nr:type II secretion system F family protein [Nitrosopumilus sp. K4]QUC65461.1 type II secretion system F family protein [Nitrosopumilus sp. K4]
MSLLKAMGKNGKPQKEDQTILFELPYFITIVTLLATSGFGPYTIFQKMREIKLLPKISLESEKIIKRIDILGMDPLTVMMQIKEKTTSKSFGEFLNGYVSSIQGGGDVVNYLKSKMNSAFDAYANTQKESVEKVKALIEAFMTMQIVVLAVYIIITATSSTGVEQSSEGLDPFFMIIVLPPVVSAFFMFVSSKLNKSKMSELDWKKIAMIGIPGVAIAGLLYSMDILPDYDAYILGIALIVASILPAIKFSKAYSLSLDSENATPQILRDIAEARKAGLGPEKCVVRACKRKDFGFFNNIANSIANKLEWGVSLNNIYKSIQKEIKDFQILISFKILFEIIAAGGGNVHTLESLAGIAEKIQNIEKSKREMLKPYVMIGFMLIGITGFTTLMVIDSLTSISVQSEIEEYKKEQLELESKSRFELMSFSIIAQAWLAGLFLGKVTTGNYSGGFKLSIFLIIITLIAIFVISQGLFDVGAFF